MKTYKFKMGRAADAPLIFEDADKALFVGKVASELAKIPAGLPMSMNFGPVLELPDESEVSGLQLQRWFATNR
jgi:hypothetical protein